MNYKLKILILVFVLPCFAVEGSDKFMNKIPADYKVVLQNTEPLKYPRGDRMPLFSWRLMRNLENLNPAEIETLLKKMDKRGIGCASSWHPNNKEKVVQACVKFSKAQQNLGLQVNVNANSCMYLFFNGDESTFHVDSAGNRFYDDSFGSRKMGCPFALQHRYPVIQKQLEYYLKAYKDANIQIDFIFGDWEIDGPIEWNNAWENSKNCSRCRQNIEDIDNFSKFQVELRKIRCDIQKKVFSETIKSYFPNALIGNYGVYPSGKYRYWYDYFEKPVDTAKIPHIKDQRAVYRKWYEEFDKTGYTLAMPVTYTWYNTFGWYDFENPDYKWFYNLLLTGTNAAKHSKSNIPVVGFVHWHTTVAPKNSDPSVKQFSEEKYKELLWHLLFRGYDSFFLWCLGSELDKEISLLHEVYHESLRYGDFLEKGKVLTFDIPQKDDAVISAIAYKGKMLIKRTDFSAHAGLVYLKYDGHEYKIPPSKNTILKLPVKK